MPSPFSRKGGIDRKAIAVTLSAGCNYKQEVPFTGRETRAKRRPTVDLEELYKERDTFLFYKERYLLP